METKFFLKAFVKYKGKDSYGFKVDRSKVSPRFDTLGEVKKWLKDNEYLRIVHGFNDTDDIKMTCFEIKKIKVTIEEEEVCLLCKHNEKNLCTLVHSPCNSNIIDCKIAEPKE